MTDRSDADDSAWANGVTLKRTRDGYTWTIAVAAESVELAAMRAAVETARQIDDELSDAYGPNVRARRRSRDPYDSADDTSAGRSHP